MAVIRIEDQIIKKGNFGFLSEVLNDDPKLADAFFEMESLLYTDINRFTIKLRSAYEAFVVYDFHKAYGVPVSDSTDSEIINRLGLQKEHGVKKQYLRSRCKGRTYLSHMKAAVSEVYGESAPVNTKRVNSLIYGIYKFGCLGDAHFGEDTSQDTGTANGPGIPEEMFNVTYENCEKFLKVFYNFVVGYCEMFYPDDLNGKPYNYKELKLDVNRIPVNNYIPVSSKIARALKLKPLRNKKYYISEESGSCRYYIMCKYNDPQGTEKREVEVLSKLWADDNDEDPANIIRLKEVLELADGYTAMMFSLPSKPLAVSEDFLTGLNMDEKEQLFKHAIKSIRTLHEYSSPFYHRDINPEAFMVCKTKTSYKLFLCNFRFAKDTDVNVDYTVFDEVQENKSAECKQQFLAPEIKTLNDVPDDIIWEKADIYSLGVLGIYIFSGTANFKNLGQDVPEDVTGKILCMCKAAPEERVLPVI